MNNKIFCLDTSSLVWATRRAYPKDVFPSFWEKVDSGIRKSTLISNKPVYNEINNVDDDLFKWAESQKDFFLEIDNETASEMPEIMKKCPNLINPSKKKDEADPFLIATAKVHGAIVITQENPLGPKNPRINIPDACKIFNIESMNLLGMMRSLGWKF